MRKTRGSKDEVQSNVEYQTTEELEVQCIGIRQKAVALAVSRAISSAGYQANATMYSVICGWVTYLKGALSDDAAAVKIRVKLLGEKISAIDNCASFESWYSKYGKDYPGYRLK